MLLSFTKDAGGMKAAFMIAVESLPEPKAVYPP